MDKTKKKVRIWMIVLILAALAIAGTCIYFYGSNNNNYSNEGTLITKILTLGERKWQ